MHCKCGYNFSGKTRLKREFKSFAVIDDENYRKFLKSELRVLQAKDLKAKLQAIYRSSKLVGSLFECPKCSRLMLRKPGKGNAVILQK